MTVNVDKNDLIKSMDMDLTHDEIFEFIKDLDLSIADWDFTLRLCDYFDTARIAYNNEVKA
jgi:hypothetical protein